MKSKVNMDELKKEAEYLFRNGYMCSETMVFILNKYYELGLSQDAVAMSTGFPFGFGDGGNVCGAVAGATMCIGKIFGRTERGDSAYKECCQKVRKLNDKIIEKYNSCLCPELIKDYDFKDPKRKDHCRDILLATIDAFDEIMNNEKSV